VIEETTVSCPVCGTELLVSFMTRNTIIYIVHSDCPKCKTPANKIENMLNRSNKKSYIKVEKSYIKTDPRG
jgi:ssDNA-binding Zn-finger/Zn-ribbon topoisomerase 1